MIGWKYQPSGVEKLPLPPLFWFVLGSLLGPIDRSLVSGGVFRRRPLLETISSTMVLVTLQTIQTPLNVIIT